MTVIAFEQAHEYDGVHSGVYEVPNEDIKQWYSIFEDLSVSRAAAICSAGEIGIITILPRVTDELLLFDHAPVSLHVAMMKCLIAKEAGVEKLHELILKPDGEELAKLAATVKDGLPSEIRDAYGKARTYYNSLLDYEPRYEDTCFLERRKDYYDDSKYLYGSAHELKRYWLAISLEWAKAGFEKLDLVKFLHGTFNDLEKEEPFDLLYISNAHEYTSRDGTRLNNQQLQALVKPGGYVAVARSRYDIHLSAFNGFERIKIEGESYNSYGTWAQELLQVPA